MKEQWTCNNCGKITKDFTNTMDKKDWKSWVKDGTFICPKCKEVEE